MILTFRDRVLLHPLCLQGVQLTLEVMSIAETAKHNKVDLYP